ncbi:MAG: ankyrin repeat domain-containing protein [Burkholderiales bacterium]|nr:ankyrin repeat domain-containing protein [Burkholderiales bacterium]
MTEWLTELKRAMIVACALLAAGGCANLPSPGTRLDADGLHNAIVADNADYVRAAVDAHWVGVDSSIPAPVYMEGTPLITIAARAGSVDVVRYLIAAGADLNAQTPAYETALMLATYFPTENGESSSRQEQVAHMLVEAGAAVNAHPYSYTALAYAAYQGRDDLIVYLIKHGAHVNTGFNANQVYVNTPLMMAAIQGHASSAALLLRAGADARTRLISSGYTAAELAAKHNGRSLVPLLRCAEAAGPGPAFIQRCERSAAR